MAKFPAIGGTTEPSFLVNGKPVNTLNRVTLGDANATITGTPSIAAITTTLTAARTYTLPAASSYAAGGSLRIVDEAASVSASLTATISAGAGDTVHGVPAIVLNFPRSAVILISNGSTKWTIADSNRPVPSPTFDQQYQDAAPTVRSDGSALVTGDRWYDTLKRCDRSWNGTRWLIDPGQWLNPKYFASVYDDFFSPISTTSTPLFSVTSGGSTGSSSTGSLSGVGAGAISLATGGAATNRAGIRSDPNAITLGAGACQVTTFFQALNVSDAANAYTFWTGLSDTLATDPTDGVCARYTHSNNSGNWQGITASNGILSIRNSNIAVADNGIYRSDVFINADGSSAEFFINDVSMGAPLTTNIPVGSGRETGFLINIVKSTGTTSRVIKADYVAIIIEFTTPR